jgi:hypothetical protein
MLFRTIYDKNHDILFLKLIDFRKNYIQPIELHEKSFIERSKNSSTLP